jgi:hypothetical protein
MIKNEYIITEEEFSKLVCNLKEPPEYNYFMKSIIHAKLLSTELQKERENLINKLFPKATKEDQKLGWKHDYKYLMHLMTLQEEISGNDFIAGLEEIDGLLTAIEKIMNE